MSSYSVLKERRSCFFLWGGGRAKPKRSLRSNNSKFVPFLYMLKYRSGLRIRIHFIRIRIQHFRLNANPDPDPIRIQGFNDFSGVIFALLDPDPDPDSESGSGFRIRIHWPDWIRIKSGSGSATLNRLNNTFARKEIVKTLTKQVGETLGQPNLAHAPEVVGRHPPIRQTLHQHLTTNNLDKEHEKPVLWVRDILVRYGSRSGSPSTSTWQQTEKIRSTKNQFCGSVTF